MFVNLGNDLVFDLNFVSSVTKGGSADIHTIVVRLQQSVSDTALVLVAKYNDLSSRDADFQNLMLLLNAKSPSELVAQDEKESISADDPTDSNEASVQSVVMRHPVQPLVFDDNRTVRFKKNKIVEFLLNDGPFDMNVLATMKFSVEDREQFAQLIGYSLSGFADLSYVSDETYERAASQQPFG